ncbi:hypothetical protein Pla175_05550 [Pirellulimonas nuda]|uniref:Uncharacterized protein n=1 Tax=Pirellulimonas nuda TaxID=2528009 RepID=A0A518D6T5_9BACT|nr:hypothetical protein [Pirellulimonas nuda]QDU87198.1 hypothetical protein Pla175_05550 [Pirellulimonas nuda]
MNTTKTAQQFPTVPVSEDQRERALAAISELSVALQCMGMGPHDTQGLIHYGNLRRKIRATTSRVLLADVFSIAVAPGEGSK